ncbi:hypothetical protein [Nonomuraea sp. NPDC002799]
MTNTTVRAILLSVFVAALLVAGIRLASSSAGDGFGWGGTSLTVAAGESPGGFGWGVATPAPTV